MGTLITKEPTWANYHYIQTREEYRAAKAYFDISTPSDPSGEHDFIYTPGTGKEYGAPDWISGDLSLVAPQPSDSALFFQEIQTGISLYLRERRNKSNWEALGYSWPSIRSTSWYNFCVDIADLYDTDGWGYRYLDAGKKIADIERGNGLQWSDVFPTALEHCSGVWLLEDLKIAFDALEEFFPLTPISSSISSLSSNPQIASTDTIRTIEPTTLPPFTISTNDTFIEPTIPTEG